MDGRIHSLSYGKVGKSAAISHVHNIWLILMSVEKDAFRKGGNPFPTLNRWRTRADAIKATHWSPFEASWIRHRHDDEHICLIE
jgi:hypothetical protein